MQQRQPWVVCVRVNRHDKAYFLHQLDGFSRIDPLLVTWEDDRPAAERAAQAARTAVVGTPWMPRWRFVGGHRLRQAWTRLRARIVPEPLAANSGEMARLETIADRHPPSVIYAHTGPVGLRLLPLKRHLGVPLVVHFHGLDITNPDRLYRAELARHVSEFDRVLVVGDWMVERLVRLGCDAARISVIPMGAVTTGVAPATAPEAPVTFVSVGRLVGVKGLDRTLAAFARVHGAHPGTELHLVGDGPLRPALEAQARDLGLGAAVVFHGQLPAEAALAQVALSHVMVHHALDEPGGPEAFGVVITEAMARGLPVIGTRCGGIPDQVVDGETGFLVEQNDVAGMAEAMARLVEDPALAARLGAAGRARAAARFDAHALARETEALLTGLAPGPVAVKLT